MIVGYLKEPENGGSFLVEGLTESMKGLQIDLLQRFQPHYPPAVVFRSSWNQDDSKRALGLGAREFIHRPMSHDEYTKAVCGIVERWCERFSRRRGA